jgi:SAP domain
MSVWSRKLSDKEREGLPDEVLNDHDEYWREHSGDEDVETGPQTDATARDPNAIQENVIQLPAEESEDDYDDWTKAELQEELETRRLNAQGNKAELIKRLRLNDEENATQS